MTRHIYEGKWHGYRREQDRVVYREVLATKAQVDRRSELRTILFTDGTTLEMSMREALPREKVQPLAGYSSLVHDALNHGGTHVSVIDMIAKRGSAIAKASTPVRSPVDERV